MAAMEPDARDLLKRVVWTFSIILLYMFANITAGIRFGLFFFEQRLRAGNYFFYAWFLASTAGLLWLLKKWWSKKFPHG